MKSKPVSKTVIKAMPLLKFISRESDKKIRQRNLRRLGGDPTVFYAMKEILENYKNQNIKLKPNQKRFMLKNEKLWKKFFCNKVGSNCVSRRRALEQTG